MALFSEKVDLDTKARMAAKLHTLKKKKNTHSQKLVKPKFPKIGPNTQLYDLVTEESLQFFSIIKVDSN